MEGWERIYINHFPKRGQDMTTKRQAEDNISKAIIKFEKEFLGRGPEEVKTYILGDMILVRLKGILTPAEQHLAGNHEGKMLVKSGCNSLKNHGPCWKKLSGISPVVQ